MQYDMDTRWCIYEPGSRYRREYTVFVWGKEKCELIYPLNMLLPVVTLRSVREALMSSSLLGCEMSRLTHPMRTSEQEGPNLASLP